MFLLILGALLIGLAIHVALLKPRTARRAGEAALLWLLVGYCGVATLGHSVLSLLRPVELAAYHGFDSAGPFQAFVGVALAAMSVSSLLCLRYRGVYLIGPAVCWTVFFAGATVVHLAEAGETLSHDGAVAIFASHGLVALLLASALVASQVWRVRE